MVISHYMRFYRVICIFFLFLLFNFNAHSQNKPAKFIQETHYLLALPDGYDADTSKKWPLVIFLHGSGERGSDLAKVKVHGPPKLVDQGKKFPFILVSPQAPDNESWEPRSLYKLLRYIKETERVDDKKVYLTGLSMGGYGTWALAMEHPEEFAAIAPVCGGGDSSKAWRLRHVAIWNFHGAKDDVVFPEQSDRMVTAARRHNHNVRYTLYPEANHNSWDSAYSNDNLYSWLLSQTKFEYGEKQVDLSTLKEYVGKYSREKNDTIGISIVNGKLLATPGRDSIYLRNFDKDSFFIEPQIPVEIIFLRKNNKVNSFMVLDENRSVYPRIN